MPHITFIAKDSAPFVFATNAANLMEAAREHSIPGIQGDCGGAGSCGTCHVHLTEEWIKKVGAAGPLEKEILELQENFTPCSRLACQIEITSALEGLVVRAVRD